MTERKEVRVTERVTIDVDPSVVETLRVAGNCGPRSDLAAMHNLADAIEAALPMPEPAAGSIVELPGGDAYGRTNDEPGSLPWMRMPWVRMVGAGHLRVSWNHLRTRSPVVVFDGATLEGPQDAPRATHSHEQGEAVPECQTGPAGRSEARRQDAPDCPYARETTPGHWLCEPWPNDDVPCQGCPRRTAR